MYIVRAKTHGGKTLAFKTFDGWDVFPEGKPLELGNVMRFTKREAELNTLRDGHEFIWIGCYKELK